MPTAVLDTTVVADALLKPGPRMASARRLLAEYETRLLPHYAIKELKAGVVRNYVYAHNKLKELGSLRALEEFLPVLHRQKYKLESAREALRAATFEQDQMSVGELAIRTPIPDMSVDEFRTITAIAALKLLILMAWEDRRSLATQVIAPLSCYPESDLVVEEDGRLGAKPTECAPGPSGCSLRTVLTGNGDALQRMKQALLSQIQKDGTRPELSRRLAAVELLLSGAAIDLKTCRHLGDAVFVLLAPPGATVLTTNTRDYVGLVQALGMQVRSPQAFGEDVKAPVSTEA